MLWVENGGLETDRETIVQGRCFMLKLYYSQGSCALAVIILIKELGINCDYEAVNLKSKRTSTGQDFLKITPKGCVPTLRLEDGQILTENVVIQQYLVDTYATQVDQHLLPSIGNINRYRVLEWLNYVTAELHKAFSPFFSAKFSAAMKAEYFLPVLKQKLDFVDQSLSGSFYLVGDHFSIVDGYLYVLLSWLPSIQLDVQSWFNLSVYVQRLRKRASIVAAFEAAGGSEHCEI